MDNKAEDSKTEIVVSNKGDNKIMTVFYIEVKHSIKNYQDVIKKVFENIKKFISETKIVVKYNHVKDAEKVLKLIDEKTVEIDSDHIYFKLHYDNLGLFKKYQSKCSVSRYVSKAYFTPTEDQKEKLLKVKNSFVKIVEENDKLLFKSRTTQSSHFYLSKKIFDETSIVITNKNFKYVVEPKKTPVSK